MINLRISATSSVAATTILVKSRILLTARVANDLPLDTPVPLLERG